MRRTVELPYFAVKKMFSENSAPPSFTMDLLSLGINDLKSEEQAMLAASAMYGGKLYFSAGEFENDIFLFSAGTETVCIWS